MRDDDQRALEVAEYEPPRVVRLGTLTELTHGGAVGLDDGLGGAGDEGSL